MCSDGIPESEDSCAIIQTIKTIRVIIAGSRNFDNYEYLKSNADMVLKFCQPDGITIISGTAQGADILGEKFAQERDYKIRRFPAEWGRYGKSAGYKRNEFMASNADALIAFWDGKSRGTQHMINIAKNHKLKVVVFNY